IEILDAKGKAIVEVRFKVGGEATKEVAKYAYREGASVAEVTVSREARGEDLQRAAAHELAEIRARAENAHLPNQDALAPNSSSDQLSAHDHGRLGELDVLLRDAEVAPGSADVANEMDGLIKHMGFDPHTIEYNPRARKLLTEDRIRKLVDTMTAREMPH